jgi:hypothetical protein
MNALAAAEARDVDVLSRMSSSTTSFIALA